MALQLSPKIDTIDIRDLTPEAFRKNYFLPQKPLLIKGLANMQPAGKKWNIDFFRTYCGDEMVDVFDNRNKLHEKTTTTKGDTQILLRDFLNIIEKDEYTPLRMFVFDLYKLKPELKKDFSCPHLFKGLLDKLGFFFMGGKNTEVRLHFDVDYNNVLLTQFYGRKSITLIAPEYTDLLYRLPFNTHSTVNLDAPDYEKYPGLNYVKGYRFVQEAGDSLFMPSRWWHYNVYLSGGIAVSYRKLHPNPLNNLWGLISLGIYLPFDKIMTRILKDNWFVYKQTIAKKKADKAIRRFQKKDNEPIM